MYGTQSYASLSLIFEWCETRDFLSVSRTGKFWRSALWTTLKHLSIPNKFKTTNPFRNSDLLWVVLNCNSLRSLDLSGVYTIDGQGFSNVSKLPYLRHLNINWCGNNIPMKALFETLSQLTNLQSLDMSWSYNWVNFSTLSLTPFPISLTSLDISYSNTSSDDIKLLSYLANLKELRINGIYKCNEESISQLCNALPRLSYVEYLWADELQFPYPKHVSIKHSVLSPDSIPVLLSMTQSHDIYERYQGVIGIRRLLSVQSNAPFDAVIASGGVGVMLNIIKTEVINPRIQFECAWALTNIASSNSQHTNFLATEGAIPVFMQLTESTDLDLKNQAFWYLANTIGDTSVKLREIICCNGITEVLRREFESCESPPEALLSNLVWCICNLFRYKPSPRYETMRWIFPHLKKCLDCKDENLIGDTLWSMAYASTESNVEVDIFSSGILPKIMTFLTNNNLQLLLPSMRVIAALTANPHNFEALFECGLASALNCVLNSSFSSNNSVRKIFCSICKEILQSGTYLHRESLTKEINFAQLVSWYSPPTLLLNCEIYDIFFALLNNQNTVHQVTTHMLALMMQYQAEDPTFEFVSRLKELCTSEESYAILIKNAFLLSGRDEEGWTLPNTVIPVDKIDYLWKTLE